MTVPKREIAEVMVDTQNNNSAENEVSAEMKNTVIEESADLGLKIADKNKKNETLYTVRLNRKHSCFVGGTYYVFEKGQVYQVPADVKRVLSVAGLLAPL